MSSLIIEQAYRNYALYVLNERALLYIQDGLRASIRRAIWIARNAQKQKTNSLSGAMAKLHPHGDASAVIQNATSMFKNNIPYFDGNDAGFGTLLTPSRYSAARYTSVKLSNFAKDAILVDVDLIPMISNYDETCEEPEYLLPLVPLHLLNPITGMAIGYKCDIVPYKLADLIDAQINVLDDNEINDLIPFFEPLQQRGEFVKRTPNGNNIWQFNGDCFKKGAKWVVTELPYGFDHTQFTNNLQKLFNEGTITNIDDNSSDHINCSVSFARNIEITGKDDVMKLLKLTNTQTECLYFIDSSTKSVKQFTTKETITTFTMHRLSYYKKRLDKQVEKLTDQTVYIKEVIKTIDVIHERGGYILQSKHEFEQLLLNNGVCVYVQDILSLPIHKFNIQEKDKYITSLQKIESELIHITETSLSDKKLRQLYKQELKNIKKVYG